MKTMLVLPLVFLGLFRGITTYEHMGVMVRSSKKTPFEISNISNTFNIPVALNQLLERSGYSGPVFDYSTAKKFAAFAGKQLLNALSARITSDVRRQWLFVQQKTSPRLYIFNRQFLI